MAHNFAGLTAGFLDRKTFSVSARGFAWLAWAGIVAALFYHLGGAALFEPDEGRNAEKAREILVLQDWLTPHENFHAVLDKPIFFYWLIALAYQFFGVSEWAARLPSALAALGTLALVYRFAQVSWGRWTALWSTLILLTSVEFFVLARIVILRHDPDVFSDPGFVRLFRSRSERRSNAPPALVRGDVWGAGRRHVDQGAGRRGGAGDGDPFLSAAEPAMGGAETNGADPRRPAVYRHRLVLVPASRSAKPRLSPLLSLGGTLRPLRHRRV